MIQISIGLNPKGLISKLEVNGHAGLWKNDGDPVCSAVSFLLRTLGRLCEVETGMEIKSRAEEPGTFFLEIVRISPNLLDWWKGVGSIVLKGLSDLSREFPENVKLQITEIILEVNHGS